MRRFGRDDWSVRILADTPALTLALASLFAIGSFSTSHAQAETKRPTQTSTPATEPTRPANQKPQPVCRAKKGQCCLPDGKVVRPCGPVTRPGDKNCESAQCGSGGFCHTCRCLPGDSLIETPDGPRAISSLSVGDPVYSQNRLGVRVRATIRVVSRVQVMSAHEVVEIQLQDGRRVTGSAPHPLGDGRTLGQLQVGDMVDGARIQAITRSPFQEALLWDLFPSGETGIYFVNGIPLRTTLPMPESGQ